MLCNYRVSSRRIATLILKETKCLLKLLDCSDDKPVIDVIDRCCPQVCDCSIDKLFLYMCNFKIVEKCLPLLPAAEKTAIQSVAAVDLQWLADRNSCIWTAGIHEDGSLKSSSANFGGSNQSDPWSICIFGFLERNRIPSLCPTVVGHSWPIVFTRINTLFPIVDPT